MSSTYLKPTDPNAFVDYPGKHPVGQGRKECPQCQGYGGWNLRLNAYKLHQYENTAENRHRHSHFRCSCSNCNGWGSVPESQTCVHDWDRRESVGNCLTKWVCMNCKQETVVDSSD